MGESSDHMKYVDILYTYATAHIPEETAALIMVDLPSSKEKPSRTSGGYIPDLSYQDDKLFVIGEAKTENDIERKHSLAQFENYYFDATLFCGKAILILSVPWLSKCRAKNIMRRIKQRYTVKIPVFIVTELMGAEEV